MSDRRVNVGIVGYGTVGKGTVNVLIDNANVIKEKTGIDIFVKSVADLKINEFDDQFLRKVPNKYTDADMIINDPVIDIVVELIGGYNAAKKVILDAIEKKKHVVTANKALLAVYGTEIFKKAEEKSVQLGFEGSVGGGIPIIKVLKEDLAANNIKEIYGIINGTANYILTRMEKEGKEFDEVLKDAQRLGYAEADPTFDIEGIDTAHKITILSSIAFNTIIPFDKVFVEGISSIKQVDIDFAKKLNCKIKLLAIAKKHENDIEVRVHPTMIPERYILSKVENVFNAIYLVSDKLDRTIHYGRGAGGLPTGSAVAGDIISIARDIICGCHKRVPVLGFTKEYRSYFPVKNIDDIRSSFYLRFMALDKPGVLSKIAGVLGKYNISISAAIQPGDYSPGDVVPLVFMTHETIGRHVSDAVREIDSMEYVKSKTVVIRVEGAHRG
ncbi:homoserine dehydrogenase [Calditerrivibrio nitroreducens]|uniref:Homoserine dehydrogenase n=1 Tax=Calditerrivibrio nitroreducens (strain DSM 19672 / NBRC 101217 / Yu37-1) TaxID=768670 RepID=E4TH84_CALNY|nr:homoserine dehydrogenase [Calditerrivibrio nitroreducens]ADR18778.1 homoserine dehydrogenase [Calditerrivibrio nitroreducens DSM 19672]